MRILNTYEGNVIITICDNIRPGEADEEIDPSEVRALPLGVAAERSVHYFWDYVSFFFPGHIILSQKGLS